MEGRIGRKRARRTRSCASARFDPVLAVDRGPWRRPTFDLPALEQRWSISSLSMSPSIDRGVKVHLDGEEAGWSEEALEGRKWGRSRRTSADAPKDGKGASEEALGQERVRSSRFRTRPTRPEDRFHGVSHLFGDVLRVVGPSPALERQARRFPGDATGCTGRGPSR